MPTFAGGRWTVDSGRRSKSCNAPTTIRQSPITNHRPPTTSHRPPSSKGRQTLLLSATLPPPVLRLANRYMVDPIHINLSPAKVTVENIRQTYITVDEDRKFDLLLRVLQRERP